MKTKDELPACPVATAVALVGGKWKLLIIRNLRVRPWRFNELQRDLEGISQKVLTDSLRQLMDDGLVHRHDYQEMPPRVDYSLTELGKNCCQLWMHWQTLEITINRLQRSDMSEGELLRGVQLLQNLKQLLLMENTMVRWIGLTFMP